MQESFKSWCVVELMGHRKVLGQAQEVELAGGKMLRIDVPAQEGQEAYTEFYGASAIYGVHPVSEEVARSMMERGRQQPFYAYMLPKALPSPASGDDE